MYYTNNKKYYMVFPDTRTFLKALPLIEQSSIEHRVVTLPYRLSDQCGMTIEIYGQFVKKAADIINNKNIKYEIKE